jgi:hypothetical protein
MKRRIMDISQTPFLYQGGRYTGPLEMTYSVHHDTGTGPRPFITSLGQGTILTANAEQVNAYLVSIVEALYGQDALTMETAELLVNRGNAVLVDNEPIKCPTCNGAGHVGAPWDLESCGSCRGTGMVNPREVMSKDEYDSLVADVFTEES